MNKLNLIFALLLLGCSKPDNVENEKPITHDFHLIDNDDWIITNSSQSFTIDKFMKSGKLCKLINWHWLASGYSIDNDYIARICVHCGKRFKVPNAYSGSIRITSHGNIAEEYNE